MALLEHRRAAPRRRPPSVGNLLPPTPGIRRPLGGHHRSRAPTAPAPAARARRARARLWREDLEREPRRSATTSSGASSAPSASSRSAGAVRQADRACCATSRRRSSAGADQPGRALARAQRAETIDKFLTEVLQRHRPVLDQDPRGRATCPSRACATLGAAGGVGLTGCGEPAQRCAAFYCPADDTIYVGQQFAADLYKACSAGCRASGGSAGRRRLRGRLRARARVRAQHPAGARHLRQPRRRTAKPFELQADCLAGTWAYSVFAEGDLQAGRPQEATERGAGGGRLRRRQRPAPRHAAGAPRRGARRLRERRPGGLPRYVEGGA